MAGTRGLLLLVFFVSEGKRFPETSNRHSLTSLPELGALPKPRPKGNQLTMTVLGLHAIVVTTAIETKLGVSRRVRITTDSYTLWVFNYSTRNWLSDLNPLGLT